MLKRTRFLFPLPILQVLSFLFTCEKLKQTFLSRPLRPSDECGLYGSSPYWNLLPPWRYCRRALILNTYSSSTHMLCTKMCYFYDATHYLNFFSETNLHWLPQFEASWWKHCEVQLLHCCWNNDLNICWWHNQIGLLGACEILFCIVCTLKCVHY